MKNWINTAVVHFWANTNNTNIPHQHQQLLFQLYRTLHTRISIKSFVSEIHHWQVRKPAGRRPMAKSGRRVSFCCGSSCRGHSHVASTGSVARSAVAGRRSTHSTVTGQLAAGTVSRWPFARPVSRGLSGALQRPVAPRAPPTLAQPPSRWCRLPSCELPNSSQKPPQYNIALHLSWTLRLTKYEFESFRVFCTYSQVQVELWFRI